MSTEPTDYRVDFQLNEVSGMVICLTVYAFRIFFRPFGSPTWYVYTMIFDAALLVLQLDST